ncbi:MAG: helix-turn-helix transcriptional regulator [Planctomycetia bacterium]|jgi:predicted DNA-binding transcriptional regulator YafY
MDALSRHEQLLRIFHLIDILFGARQPLTAPELKDRLRDRGVIDDMSEKNLGRDVEFLGRFGYAIKETRKRTERGTARKAWSIEPGRGMDELAVPAVTLPELLSLVAAREFLAPLAGTFYWRGIGQLLAKLERVATPELMAYAEAHKEGLVVHPKPAAAKYGARMLSAVNTAIRNGVELAIRYQGLADPRPKRIVIQPEALVLYEGSVYIAARRAPSAASTTAAARRSRGDDAVRFYKLDRVVEARQSSRRFTRRLESIEALLADSITIYRSTEPARRYRVRIDAERARWACEKPFHPRQRVRRQADGGVVLEIERAWDAEMIPQLLALGSHAEVLEPADVRESIAAEARQIAARYAGRGLRSFEARNASG